VSAKTKTNPDEIWDKFQKTKRRRYKHQLVEHYVPMVRVLAEQMCARLPRTVDRDDMVGAGLLGLYKAVENFDPEKGVKFETYGKLRVRGAMIDYLRQLDWIPREARNRGARLLDVIRVLHEKLGREPTELEVARKLGVSLDEFRAACADLHFSTMVSLSSPGETADDPEDFGLSSEEHEPSAILNRRDMLAVVEQELTDVERRLVRAYYYEGLTLKAIGRQEGISESRVCQIHGRMLDRLAVRLAHAV